MKKNKKEYALYKGDEFIADGTIKEISERTGKSVSHLTYMTYPTYKRRKDCGNRLQMYVLEEEEGE